MGKIWTFFLPTNSWLLYGAHLILYPNSVFKWQEEEWITNMSCSFFLSPLFILTPIPPL